MPPSGPVPAPGPERSGTGSPPAVPRRPRRAGVTPRRWALTAALIAVVTTGACGDDGDTGNGDPPPTSPTPPPETTTTTVTAEQEVEQAYLAFWDMATRLARNPDPDDPEITERATGSARGNLVDGLTTLQSLGQETELGPSYSHNVLSVEVNSDRAVVTDCAIDDSKLIDTDTGDVAREETVTELVEVTLLRQQGRWMVDRSERIDAWAGVREC